MMIAGFILLGLGIGFLILGLIFCAFGKRNKRSSQVEGTIVDMCYNSYMYNHGGNGNVKAGISSGSQSLSSSCPVFEYQVNGVTYKRADKVAYNRGRLMRIMGQQRVVYYDPDNPQDASLSMQSPLTVIGVVFSVLGAVMIIMAIVFLIIGS